MVSLNQNDRDVTRFMWPENPFKQNSKILAYRFQVVLFGATCSQFLLNAVIRYHLNKIDSSLSREIQRNLYIDNLQGLSSTEEDLIKFYHDSQRIFLSAGLNLREWATNSPLMQEEINNHSDEKHRHKQTEILKVLGMHWLIEHDSLTYPGIVINSDHCTKRSVLQSTAKIFDPSIL